jgi:hypothetical protein
MISVVIVIAIGKAVTIAIAVVIPVPVMISVAIMIVVSVPIPGAVHLPRVDDEICAAAAIYPYSLLIESPCRALNTRGLASLPLHGDSAARVSRAVVAMAVL